ncbi:MAG: electron transport complex subunit RsxG [Methylococcaceae bacterium]|nr:MAG: electron transport complex subunit RsxG [Methylococcaceae bacterium]
MNPLEHLDPAIVKAARVLGLFALLGMGTVGVFHAMTAGRIAANERAILLHSLQALVPAERCDNDMLTDRLEIFDPEALGSRQEVPVYRARKSGEPVAAVFASVAPDGYNGDIKLLVAINADGSLAGVRVVGHKETPGLGDGVEASRSNWIHRFTGLSLSDPAEAQWKVRRDGGRFDQFAGATITPRAVVKAVYKTLLYFRAHREALFTEPAIETEEAP